MGSKTLIWIRWRQARKELSGAGIIYVLLLLLIVFALAAFLYTQFLKGTTALVFSLLIPATVCSLHISRRDKTFIFRHLEQPVIALYTEYLVFTLPLIIAVLATRYWYAFLFMQASFYGIAHIRTMPAPRTWFNTLSKVIPARDFEWLSGVRKGAPLLLFFYLTALGLSWLIIAPLLCLWLISAQLTSFYLECEPLVMLWANADTPGQLLQGKIRRHVLLQVIISFPVLLLHSILCPDMVLINICFLAAQLLLLVFAILLKYTTYSPGKLMTGNNIILGFAALSVAIPFLLPVPLFMAIRNYGRAIKNLKAYTYDPHP